MEVADPRELAQRLRRRRTELGHEVVDDAIQPFGLAGSRPRAGTRRTASSSPRAALPVTSS